MKVFYSATIRAIESHSSFLLKAYTLLKENTEIVEPWIEKYINTKTGIKKDLKTKNYDVSIWYKQTNKAIQTADICIFDVSYNSMGLGHQVALSMERKKPTLVLSHIKMGEISNLLIAGSGSGYLTLKDYKDEKELEGIIKKFVEKNKTNKKIRLNLALDSLLVSKLESTSLENKKSKTQIINEALELYLGDQ